MKPHALRRVLQIGCLATGAGVVAAGFHLFANVRPATAAWVNRPSNQIEQRWCDMAGEYDSDARLLATQGTRQQGPVKQETVKDVFLRYATSTRNPNQVRDPVWFPFVGPKAPPEVGPKPTGPTNVPPPPTGLEAIGKPVMVLSRTLLFQFNGHDSDGATAINVGEFIRYSDKDAKRFRLVALEEAPVLEVLEGDGTRREILGSRIVYEALDKDGNREGDLRADLVVYQRGADTLDLVCGDRHADARAADEDAPVRLAVGDRHRDRVGHVGVVAGPFLTYTQGQRDVAVGDECFGDGTQRVCSAVVGTQCDIHRGNSLSLRASAERIASAVCRYTASSDPIGSITSASGSTRCVLAAAAGDSSSTASR